MGKASTVSTDRARLAQRLDAAIRLTGLTFEDFAASAGLSESYVFKVRTGLNEPGALRLARICRAANVSADELLGLSPVAERPAPVPSDLERWFYGLPKPVRRTLVLVAVALEAGDDLPDHLADMIQGTRGVANRAPRAREKGS